MIVGARAPLAHVSLPQDNWKSHRHQNRLLLRLELWRGDSWTWSKRLLQKRFRNRRGRYCTKHLKNERILFVAFSPKRKGKNSQGPIKIKIYNLCNVLHRRHLSCEFYFGLAGGWGVNELPVTVSRARRSRLGCVLSQKPNIPGYLLIKSAYTFQQKP